MRKAVLILSFFATSLSLFANNNYTDAEIKKLLVGSWKLSYKDQVMKVEGLTTYKANGTLNPIDYEKRMNRKINRSGMITNLFKKSVYFNFLISP